MRFAKIKAALLFGLGGFFLEAMIFVRRKMTVLLFRRTIFDRQKNFVTTV